MILSEPMSGGDRPDAIGDVYFAFYTMAMRTGTVRSAARLSELLDEAGFTEIQIKPARRPFVTQAITARKSVTSL